ncbi:flagellar FlbD family protein [Thalassoroseus pseudoceratinae]|uniref:flagellar FlbD family protein n=1 Tax=Thalassoroseus pseudoceratinae TaxID=2713176 RepID=UPI001423436C|nr:flagellar FlbD family protein [Thalassoroseus pseudoceratinae]
MIKLTRLGGEEFVVNAELIRMVESRPDTFVTLTTNDRFIVRESVAEVVKRSLAYRRLTNGNLVDQYVGKPAA